MSYLFPIVVLVTALAMAFSQTLTALFRRDPSGNVIGLHVFGVPFDLVVAIAMTITGLILSDPDLQRIALAIALGSASSYAVTWGRAFAFVAVSRRAPSANDLSDPSDD